jgi:hypothetical protein
MPAPNSRWRRAFFAIERQPSDGAEGWLRSSHRGVSSQPGSAVFMVAHRRVRCLPFTKCSCRSTWRAWWVRVLTASRSRLTPMRRRVTTSAPRPCGPPPAASAQLLAPLPPRSGAARTVWTKGGDGHRATGRRASGAAANSRARTRRWGAGRRRSRARGDGANSVGPNRERGVPPPARGGHPPTDPVTS